MIPQWNKPSMCIPRMVSSNFAGLQRFYITKSQNTRLNIMVQMVEENKIFFTDYQISRAYRAHKLLHTCTGLSLHCRYQATDQDEIYIDLAKKVYGTDVAFLKGKTFHQSTAPVVNEFIEIPREVIASQYNIDLCIDTMFLNVLALLTTNA